tara:strand:+ start:311 stop:799 length:489 start_codon:yes stop_codon:yes gene_type:complete
MISGILIKNDEISCINIKNFTLDNIYKKCGFKSGDNFAKVYEWKYLDNSKIELWGKVQSNKSNTNNNTFLTSNNITIYGKGIILLNRDDTYVSLSHEEFNSFFNIITNSNNNEETIYNNNQQTIFNNNSLELTKQEVEYNSDITTSDSELSFDLYEYSSQDD